MSETTVTVTDNRTGKNVVLPVKNSVYGEAVVDIASLPKELGLFSYDPGFVATASCSSAITFLDGPKGE